jgi:hypothetical protein
MKNKQKEWHLATKPLRFSAYWSNRRWNLYWKRPTLYRVLYIETNSFLLSSYVGPVPVSLFHDLAPTPPPLAFGLIQGRYWSAKTDDISL